MTCKFTVEMKPRRILHEKTQRCLAGVTCKFTVEMKARRILHEKTQRFLRGWRRTEEGVYINKEERLMTFLELHTCWILRNCVCLVLAHMLDATQLCLFCHCTHAGCYVTVFENSLIEIIVIRRGIN